MRPLLADTANVRIPVRGMLVESVSIQLLSCVKFFMLKDSHHCAAREGAVQAVVGPLWFLCWLRCMVQLPVPVGIVSPSKQLAALHAADGSVQRVHPVRWACSLYLGYCARVAKVDAFQSDHLLGIFGQGFQHI